MKKLIDEFDKLSKKYQLRTSLSIKVIHDRLPYRGWYDSEKDNISLFIQNQTKDDVLFCLYHEVGHAIQYYYWNKKMVRIAYYSYIVWNLFFQVSIISNSWTAAASIIALIWPAQLHYAFLPLMVFIVLGIPGYVAMESHANYFAWKKMSKKWKTTKRMARITTMSILPVIIFLVVLVVWFFL